MTAKKKAVEAPAPKKPDIEFSYDSSRPIQLILIKNPQSGWKGQEIKWIAFFLGIAYGLIISKVARGIYDSKEKAGPAQKEKANQETSGRKAGR